MWYDFFYNKKKIYLINDCDFKHSKWSKHSIPIDTHEHEWKDSLRRINTLTN